MSVELAHMWLDGWGMLVWLASAAFWILVIAAIVALVRGHVSGPSGGRAALQLLEERYARGEIDRGEFIERRAVLIAPAPPRPREPQSPAAAAMDPGAAAPPEAATPPGPGPSEPAAGDDEETRPLS